MQARPRILERASRHDRREARATLGKLRHNRIAPKTLTRYTHAVAAFSTWLMAYVGHEANSAEELDAQVGWYIEHLWEEGESRSLAGDCISGIQHLLLTKRILPGSWSLVGTWCRLEMPARAPPIAWEVVLGMAGLAVSEGDFSMAVALLLGFHCFLRVGELLGI